MTDVLDIRNLADDWYGAIEDLNERTNESASYGELADVSSPYEDLCDQLGIDDQTPDGLRNYGDHYEPALIAESYFKEYAQDLAEECGLVPDDLSWPLTCIDWEQAADELKYDYSLVRFDDTDYYIRSV